MKERLWNQKVASKFSETLAQAWRRKNFEQNWQFKKWRMNRGNNHSGNNESINIRVEM